MKYWIFPSNLDKFDSIEHFKKDKQVRWRQVKQSQSAEIDDIVFVYITKNDGKYSQTLAVQARIVDINKTEYPILLEQVEFFQTPIPLKVLQAIGIVKYDKDNIQSPRFITKEQADKIFEFASNLNLTNNEQEMPNNNIQNKTAKNPSLNQILYGPPGTGKTYNTINKALEILGVETQDKSRAELKAKFDEFCQNGQIEFVTFHQSFSYEEFVEGIKPIFVDENGNEVEHSKNMIYKHKRGVFKKICETALQDLRDIQNRIKSNPYVWKVSLEDAGGELHQYCLKNNEIRIGFQHDGGDKNPSVKHFKDEMQKGDIVGIFNDKQSFNAVGVIIGNCDEQNIDKKAKITENYPITRKVKWIIKDCIIENIDNQGKQLDRNTIYQLEFRVNDLFEKIQDKVGYTFDDLPNKITCKDLSKEPYILIIDEINRGNISKILGELITLIEPSKRIGADEELRVTLPYSNESFGVPKNLYIIGTMNTADRSIALLDTALRRRFEFVEMMPQPELLKNIWIVKDTEQRDNENLVIPKNRIEELDKYMSEKSNCLYKILDSINNRIEFLLDREHTIGHAFFFEKAKFYKKDKLEWYELTLESLKEIFVKKIIPLLQEYFYDDYAKIDAVLNKNEMIKPFSMSDLDVKLSDEFVDSEKRIYRITDFSSWDIDTFTQIYGSKNTDKSNENE